VPTQYGIDESCTFNSRDPCAADGHTANSSTNIVDLSIDFITRNADSPFYLNVWLHVSHNLLNPSAEQKAACAAMTAACACSGLSDNQTTCAHEIFWAAQYDADAQIGRLLTTLGDLDLNEQTLIMFSTDK
jgi:membrane-anchored protein YejM (alkaline phosphatase superfamily)